MWQGGQRLAIVDALGLRPFALAAAQTRLALFGDPYAPPSRFDLSSLSILRPALALQAWRAARPSRQVPIYNLFNRTPTPIEEGWSVRKTQVRDYRGGRLSYDSHNGTDFVLPPGTPIVAPAAGRVVLITREFHRGGLKLMLDHGEGLTTSYAHLGRVERELGDLVGEGEPIARSGASGLNFLGALLTDPPHLHFNVWLDGVAVDPFAADGEVALWRDGNSPTGARPRPNATIAESGFDAAAVEATIAACRDPELRATLEREAEPSLRAAAVTFHGIYHPTRFAAHPRLYRRQHPRAPRLALPLRAEDVDGVAYLPDVR